MRIVYVLCIISILSLQYNIGIIPWGLIQSNKLILFETVENETYGAHEEKKDYVIYNQTEWEALWNISFGWGDLPPLPNVNFSISTIIGVYFGIKPSGGYSIQISSIIDTENAVIIYIREKEPHGIVSAVLTHPFHIVKTEKLIKSAIFIHYKDQSFLVNRELFKWTLAISIIITFIDVIVDKNRFKRKQRKRKSERKII